MFPAEKRYGEGVEFFKGGVETRNPGSLSLFQYLVQVLRGSRDGILLWGEPGTGKTTLARRIYDYKRHLGLLKGPLIEINCAALEEKEAPAVLFGEALSGGGSRSGALAAAHGGMLILDELDRLSPEAMRRFLSALESGHCRPLGALEETPCQFDLVAATRFRFEQDYSPDPFREEFLFRIAPWHFHLPPLREMRDDFAAIVENVLIEIGKPLGKPPRFEPQSLEYFLNFALSPGARWKGNYRDLYRVLKRMAVISGNTIRGETVWHETDALLARWVEMEKDEREENFMGDFQASVDTDDPLSKECLSGGEPPVIAAAALPSALGDVLEGCDEFDRVQLRAVLEVCRESETMAAAGRKLFAKSRARRVSVNDSDRLKKYLARFALTWEMVKG